MTRYCARTSDGRFFCWAFGGVPEKREGAPAAVTLLEDANEQCSLDASEHDVCRGPSGGAWARFELEGAFAFGLRGEYHCAASRDAMVCRGGTWTFEGRVSEHDIVSLGISATSACVLSESGRRLSCVGPVISTPLPDGSVILRGTLGLPSRASQVAVAGTRACVRFDDGGVGCVSADAGTFAIRPGLVGATDLACSETECCAVTGRDVVCWRDSTGEMTTLRACD